MRTLEHILGKRGEDLKFSQKMSILYTVRNNSYRRILFECIKKEYINSLRIRLFYNSVVPYELRSVYTNLFDLFCGPLAENAKIIWYVNYSQMPKFITNDIVCLNIAKQIKYSENFEYMSILANRFEQIGITDKKVIGTCKSKGPFVKHNWVLESFE